MISIFLPDSKGNGIKPGTVQNDIRIVNPITGEILRDLTLDPNRDYQPHGTHKGPNP